MMEIQSLSRPTQNFVNVLPNISIMSITPNPSKTPTSCRRPETSFILSLLRTSNMTTYSKVPAAIPENISSVKKIFGTEEV